MLPTTATTYRTEAPVEDTADLANILRTITAGLTAGMPTWTAIDHAAHDPRVVRLHLRSGDDVHEWAEWLLRRWAVSAHGETTRGATYTRHSRMVYAHGWQVELFHLERVGGPVPRGEYLYRREPEPAAALPLPSGVHGEPLGGRHG